MIIFHPVCDRIRKKFSYAIAPCAVVVQCIAPWCCICYLNIPSAEGGKVLITASGEGEGNIISGNLQLSGDEGMIIELPTHASE